MWRKYKDVDGYRVPSSDIEKIDIGVKKSAYNENLDKDIIILANEPNNQGELLVERCRVLSEILEELGY
ncbi:hypothetical protein EAI30_06580 [Romboutsia ilealis]|uniref:Uncharacterized protein n=1 Tax=Romboutsia faecis TaxID=2764597 RepID=A0ABR7JPB2_9FIRM|nr:hypothetical protein [Romboutsia faecis]MBC5996752.1 hypothetical protein [Romboutsia faecis]MRN24279.1 hypothetical protein [Romboutsia ilealis]